MPRSVILLVCGIVVTLSGLGGAIAFINGGQYALVTISALMMLGGLGMVVSGAILRSRERRG